MAITSLGMTQAAPFIPYASSSAPTIAGIVTMSSTLVWTGAIIPITKAGDISKIWLYLVNSNASNIYTVSIESVNANGSPSGTLWAANTQKTGLTGYGNASVVELTLDAAATVAVNDVIAVVVKITTFVGNANVGGYSDGSAGDLLPVVTSTTNSGSTWVARTQSPMLGLEYSDGLFPNTVGLFPFYAVNITALTASSNPRIAGNAMTFPVGVRATGLWFWADNDADVRLRLYDSDGTTVLWTYDFDKDLPYAISTAMVFTVYFSTPIELAANQKYFLMIEGLGTSVSFYDVTCYSANALLALNGGAIAVKATAASSSPSSPSDFTISTTNQATCGLLFNGVDIPAGSGSETSYVFAC